MRYNIALLPITTETFITEAQNKFSSIADGYLLSSESIPHITLAQFNLEDPDILVTIWNDIKSYSPIPPICPIGLTITKRKKRYGEFRY